MLRSVRQLVRLSVCLSHFLIICRSLDGDMRTSLFHTHSIGAARYAMPASKCYQQGGISFRRAILARLRWNYTGPVSS